jgi:preprotein translocase subunit SecG
MTLTILNVIYVLLAIAMIGFILVQRGAGAQAGSGFGAGASATVFGSRGAGNFLTKSTAILATLFFLLSIGTGMYVTRSGVVQTGSDLGIMEGADAPEASEVPAVPATDVPAAPAGDAPAATIGDAPSDVPAAPAAETTAPAPAAATEESTAKDSEDAQ